jgi:hypothetical protein
LYYYQNEIETLPIATENASETLQVLSVPTVIRRCAEVISDRRLLRCRVGAAHLNGSLLFRDLSSSRDDANARRDFLLSITIKTVYRFSFHPKESKPVGD